MQQNQQEGTASINNNAKTPNNINSTSNPHFSSQNGAADQLTENTSKFKRRGSTGTYVSNKGAQQSSCYTNQSYTECTDQINFYAKSRTFRTSQNSIMQNPITNPSKINSHLIPYIETSSLQLHEQHQNQQHNTDNYQNLEVDSKKYKGPKNQDRTSTNQLFQFSRSGGIEPRVRKPLMKRSISLKSGKFMSYNNGSTELGPLKYEVADNESIDIITKLNTQINNFSQETHKLRGVILQLEKEKKELQSRLEQRIVTFTVKEAKWNKQKEALVDKIQKQDMEMSDMRANIIELQKKIQIKEYFAQNNVRALTFIKIKQFYQNNPADQQKKPPASAGGAFSVVSGRRASSKYSEQGMMSPTNGNSIPKPPPPPLQNLTLSSTQGTTHFRKSSIHEKEQVLFPLREAQQSSHSSAFVKRNSIKSPPMSPQSNFPTPMPPSSISLKRNSMVASPDRSNSYQQGSNGQRKFGRSSISHIPDEGMKLSSLNSPTSNGNTNRPMIRKYARAIKKLQLQKKVHSVSGNNNSGNIRERNASIGTVIPGGIIIPSQHSQINQGSQSFSLNTHHHHHHHHEQHLNNLTMNQDSSYQNQMMFNCNQVGNQSKSKNYFNQTAGFGSLNASKRSASITPQESIKAQQNQIAHSSMINLKSGRYDDNEEDQLSVDHQELGEEEEEEEKRKPFATVRGHSMNQNTSHFKEQNSNEGDEGQSPQFFSRQRLIKANKQHNFFSPQRNDGQYSFQVIRKAPNLINIQNINGNYIGRHQTPKAHQPNQQEHQNNKLGVQPKKRGGDSAPQPGNSRPVFTRSKLYQNLVQKPPNQLKEFKS